MNPDFSPEMLRGFVHAQITMAGYREAFPDERKSVRRVSLTFDEACAAERARLIKRSRITPEQMDLVLAKRKICPDARLRLWKALGADPARFGIRLVGMAGQEVVS